MHASPKPTTSHNGTALAVFTVAVLGAESTGKSSLVQGVAAHANANGWVTAHTSECVRDWVAQHQRTPLAHEQEAIALAQTQAGHQAWDRLATLDPLESDYAPTSDSATQANSTAQARSPRLLLLDTTAIMTAAYSAHYFDDHSLWAYAFAARPQPDVYLLMGLDLPWQADGLQRDSVAVQHQVDQHLRHALTQHGCTFQTIYGSGTARVMAAWKAITAARNTAPKPASNTLSYHALGCEGCADPDCERRLFRRLF